MHPRTFQIVLSKPFGVITQHAYVFKIHADSWDGALAWVARVFPGIDIERTRQMHLNRTPPVPPQLARPGNSSPVSIIDCDAFSRRKGRQGTAAWNEFWPEGHWRCSSTDVADDLAKILAHLQSERLHHQKAFAFDCACYERNGRPWEYARAEERRAAIEKALTWQEALWAEYRLLERARVFELPARKAA